jgi:hypothetical protein
VIVHFMTDVFVFASWFAYSLKSIFLAVLSPISYFFQVLKSFFGTAFGTSPAPGLTYTFTNQIVEIFQNIPGWSYYGIVLGAVLVLVIGIDGVKLLLNT